jgi:restriction system protein
MKFDWKMHENSLFAVLLRSPWWISMAVAAAIAFIAQVWLPIAYALMVGFPFFVIGGISAWRQLQVPGESRVTATVQAARAMAWSEFSTALEAALQKDGYAVTRVNDAAADFEAVKGYRTTLVSGKRWKAARTGIEAHECAYVVAGELSDNARKFAIANKIRLVHDADLARLMPELGRR